MMDNDNAGMAWTVTSQQAKPGPLPTGGFGSGVEIAFRMANGMTGSVFVADSQLTAEKARELINAKVAQLTAIGGLSG